jgi:RHS repeat-associated protein
MKEANNRYARVRRSYYPGGALKTDSTALGFYDAPSIDEATRGQVYTYDLAGRRTSMQWYFDTINYQYNDFGALELISNPTDQYRITYYLNGLVDSLNLGTGVKEKRIYDNDGRLISKNRISTSGSLGTLVSDSLGYDKMNRVIAVAEQVSQQGTERTRVSYDGIGGVLAKETSNGLGARVEEFRNDAFGNVVRRLTRRTAGLVNDAPFTMVYGPNGELTSATAQVSSPAGQNQRNDQLLRDFTSSGQLLRDQQLVRNPNTSNSVELQTAERHYYGADDRLMAVQRYSYRSPTVSDGTWEEYWYDALGRRVLTRARRDANATPPVSFAYTLCMGSIQCRSFKERVWWDGDNALLEERTAEGSSSDVSNSGVIGNIHGVTLDEPLAVIADQARIINYNWRGQGMSSVFTNGAAGDISLGNTATEVDWPAATQAETYFAKSPDATQSNNAKRWLGTFVANGQGTTGMLYRRNRYFDPKSGQFTQADPIGIAGGMNVFGFADGDPINFSDPFGLCPPCVGTEIGVGLLGPRGFSNYRIEQRLARMNEEVLPLVMGFSTPMGVVGPSSGTAIGRIVSRLAARFGKPLAEEVNAGVSRVEFNVDSKGTKLILRGPETHPLNAGGEPITH